MGPDGLWQFKNCVVNTWIDNRQTGIIKMTALMMKLPRCSPWKAYNRSYINKDTDIREEMKVVMTIVSTMSMAVQAWWQNKVVEGTQAQEIAFLFYKTNVLCINSDSSVQHFISTFHFVPHLTNQTPGSYLGDVCYFQAKHDLGCGGYDSGNQGSQEKLKDG